MGNTFCAKQKTKKTKKVKLTEGQKNAVKKIVDYCWDDEIKSYEESVSYLEKPEEHIIFSLLVLKHMVDPIEAVLAEKEIRKLWKVAHAENQNQTDQT